MLKMYFELFVRFLQKSHFRILDKIFTIWVTIKPNVLLKGRLILSGLPIIDIRKGCSLHVGDRVMLNSRNCGYHINMHSPVKLFADWPGAEIHIGEKTRIHGTCIHAYKSIIIGKHCLIAANCQLFDGNGHDLSFHEIKNRINTKGTSKPIIIKDNVWIAANSIILPGVTIGEGSVITANSVVVNNIPSMVLAGGNPAKIIKDFGRETSRSSSDNSDRFKCEPFIF